MEKLVNAAALFLIFAEPAAAREPPVSDVGTSIFASDLVSTQADERTVTFDGSGRVAFARSIAWMTSTIMLTRKIGGNCSTTAVTGFSGRWLDLEPAFSPDGTFIIFSSNRPAGGEMPIDGKYFGKMHVAGGGNLWRVNCTTAGWSRPRRLPDNVNTSSSLFEPNIARNGDLYYRQADSDGGSFHLMCAHRNGGADGRPSRLDLLGPVGSSDMDSAISPDGRLLVFASNRVGTENRL